ncbi:MAG TPA: FecR family protein [Fluviicoccus sp.]|nr:FecR family protein [Fluviicoccus sp.]
MNRRPKLLNPQGLLAAMVAMTLSGAALAETAGRVNFVTGGVVAVSSDGSKRTLTRGDFINSGERIETNKGRVQIRFTDGSFLSLQPETVFGVDSYTFSKAQPDAGSLLFNFVRGSMRTVSGAIGKVNRANYRVKTPVATIGIRGTGYSGRFVNGVLLVSVSKGMVNVANDMGNSNVGTGQTFQVRDGEAPAPAPANTTAGGRADQPQSDRSDNQDDNADDQDSGAGNLADNAGPDSSGDTGLIAGEQVTDSGGSIIDVITGSGPVLSDTVTTTVNGQPVTEPIYSLATSLLPSLSDGGPAQSSNIAATFNQTDYRGGLQTVGFVGDTTNSTGISAGTAAIVNVRTRVDAAGNGISFGEWTNGNLDLTSFGSPFQHTLAANQFLPYIIGTTPGSIPLPGSNTYVRYSLSDASTPRVMDGSSLGGRLTRLTIGLDLSSTFLADIDMGLELGSAAAGNLATYNTSGQAVTAQVQGNGLSFSGLLTTSAQDSNCVSGCLTSMDGFFTGSQGQTMGLVYEISGAQGSGIQGAAVLDQTASFTIRPVLSEVPVYNFSSPFQRTDGLFHTLNVAATFDSAFGLEQGRLLSMHEGDAPFFSVGTAKAVSVYTDPDLRFSIGEFNLGTVNYDGYDSALDLKSPMSYIVGLSPTNLPATNAKVTYDLQTSGSFASTPRFAQSSTLATSLDKLSLTLNLGEGLMDVFLQASTGTGTGKTTYTASRSGYNFPTLVNAGAIQLENGDLVATATGADTSCNSKAGGGCDTRLSAFLMGNDSEMLGVSWAIEEISGSNRLTGVAALGQSANTPVTGSFPAMVSGDSVTPAFSGVFTTDNLSSLGGALMNEAAVTAVFNQANGSLLAAQYIDDSDGSVHTYGQTVTQDRLAVADVDHYKGTLSWGRLYGLNANSTASFDSTGADDELDLRADPALGLSLPDVSNSLHYIVGQRTDPTVLAGVTATVSYDLIGGTNPTSVNRSTQAVGTLDSGNLSINFGTGATALSLGISLPISGSSPAVLSMSTTGTLTGNRLNFQDAVVSQNTVINSGAPLCPTASCTWQTGGFLAGSLGEMAGIGYRVSLDANAGAQPDIVTGTAGFETLTPPGGPAL